MKRRFRAILSITLCAIMILGSVAIGGEGFADVLEAFSVKANAEDYKTGDIIEFGSYPQSREENELIIKDLNNIAAESKLWQSSNYYSGTGSFLDGQMAPSDYTHFIDVEYNDEKYRGVVFDSYRPENTGYSTSVTNGIQKENGYVIGTTYWFKYEPIKWKVLDPKSGLVISESILDAQAYSNYMYRFVETNPMNRTLGDTLCGDKEGSFFAKDYAFSSIRKWLNYDFYNTAFTEDQKKSIIESNVDNSSTDSASTKDFLFILSYDEVTNSDYGFENENKSSPLRKASGSDYSKSQGLIQSFWMVRSLYSVSKYDYFMYTVDNFGYVTSAKANPSVSNFSILNSVNGIRPAMRLSNHASGESNHNITTYKTGDIIEFGWYPQSKETNKSITDALTSSAGNTLGWNSYNYYSGTGSTIDGQMKPSNYMRYTDVMYGSTKYRGVIFDSYRPNYTGYTSSASNTNQDDNGYTTGNVYWFKYEPIKWRVLDPEAGMVMAETILDSQAFNNYILSSGSDEYGNTAYWGDSAKTYYANNYEKSSIREWLNSDFYNTAFSPAQQNIISFTTLDNSAYSASYSAYNSATTNDKIYLLSYNNTINSDYGFSTNSSPNSTRKAQGSDYAKAQGLWINYSYSPWHLRSTGRHSEFTCYVDYDGYINLGCTDNDTQVGVRPALNFNLSSDIFQSEVKDTGTAAGSGTGDEDIAENAKEITGTVNYYSKVLNNMKKDDCEATYPFYYDDKWFFEDSNAATNYNHDLVKMSMRMALSATRTTEKSVKDLYSKLEFNKCSYNFVTPPTGISIGYAFGTKNVTYNGETIDLIAVTIRSGGYKSEWASNFLIGTGSYHEGFYFAASIVLSALKKYIEANNIDVNKAKIWISGYSRGAATANILASFLDDGEIKSIDNDDVFAFCFECPQTVSDYKWNSEKYNNIVNIVNPIDLVTKVAMSSWGYSRFGITYYLPNKADTSNYSQKKDKMKLEYTKILDMADPGETHYTFLNEYADEYYAQASLVDDVVDLLASEFVSKENYRNSGSEARLFDFLEGTFADNDSFDIADVIVLIFDHLGIATHVFTAAKMISYIKYIGYAHYPELCMAWLDSIEGKSEYTSKTGRHIFVNCPVDVYVYDSNNNLVGQIIDDNVIELENGIEAYIDSDGQKKFRLPSDNLYNIKLVANGDGTMSYCVADINEELCEAISLTNYYDISIKKDDIFTSSLEPLNSDNAEYELMGNGIKIEPSLVDSSIGIKKKNVNVKKQGYGYVFGGGSYFEGEYAALKAETCLENGFLGWYEGNQLLSTENEYRFRVESDKEVFGKFLDVNVSIRNSKNIDVDYKSKVTLNAECNIEELSIAWYNAETDIKIESGKTYTIEQATRSFSVYAAAVDSYGNIVAKSETETVSVKVNFFAKLIAFFRGLFHLLPIWIDNVKQ